MAWTAPPVRSTAARKSVMAGSGELLTTIAWTWRTPLRSRIQLAFALPVSTRPAARSRATLACGAGVLDCACAMSSCDRPRTRASEIRSQHSADRDRRSLAGTMSVEVVLMVASGTTQSALHAQRAERERRVPGFRYIEKHPYRRATGASV